MIQDDTSFLGTGWGFPVSFDRNSAEVNSSTEDEDIKDSLMILLNTTPGERIMQPRFGCGLRTLIFESISESEKSVIRDLISRAIRQFEPRIKLIDVTIDTKNTSTVGTVQLGIEYLIRAVNTRSNIVFPFYLSEGTNVRM